MTKIPAPAATEEINQTIGYEEARQEAARCTPCGLCFDCRQCFIFCNGAAFTRVEETSSGNYFVMALDACEGCGNCIEACPCGYLGARDCQPIDYKDGGHARKYSPSHMTAYV